MHTIVKLGLQLDRHYAIVMLVIQSESSLTIVLVGNVIRIIDDLPKINCIESL